MGIARLARRLEHPGRGTSSPTPAYQAGPILVFFSALLAASLGLGCSAPGEPGSPNEGTSSAPLGQGAPWRETLGAMEKPVESLQTSAFGPSAALPLVGLLPEGWKGPCESERVPFSFRPQTSRRGPREAFWMMWTALRAFSNDLSALERELRPLGYSQLQWLSDPWTGTRALLAQGPEGALLAFRGSTDLRNWIADFYFIQEPGETWGVAGRIHGGMGKCHEGLWNALLQALKTGPASGKPLWITGHSLGGALATLTATRLVRTGYPVAQLTTFAAPRVGDGDFAADAERRLRGKIQAYAAEDDLVPHLPPSAQGAKEAARIATLEFAVRAAENLLVSMDYDHPVPVVSLSAQGTALAAPPGNHGDERYWKSIADGGGLLRLLQGSSAQGARHKETAYLCLLASHWKRSAFP